MPIEIGFWRLGDKAIRIPYSPMQAEKRLEDVLSDDLSILDPNLLLIGRQVPTTYGKFIDLLALDSEANLVVIELKRARTPRDVVAQLLDYGSWVRHQKDDGIAAIFSAHIKKHHPDRADTSLDETFLERFKVARMPETMNESHRLLVVASELDDATERIINYLAEYHGVPINAAFFRFFRDGENSYLSRAWLTDPTAIDEKSAEKSEILAPWNQEYYVSFGGEHRDWEEAQKYGFVSAGGGRWYSKTLELLEEGARIWVNITGGVGYVGVGRVTERVVPIDKFLVDDGHGNQVPITDLSQNAAKHGKAKDDPDTAEYMVRVKWIKAVPVTEAIREKGFFGNTNSVARPRAKKWLHTIDRLKQRFGVT